MRTYLDADRESADSESRGYCPECGQSLTLAPKLKQRARGRPPRWAWLVLGLGLLLALGFGVASWRAKQSILATTNRICGTVVDYSLAAVDDRATQCLHNWSRRQLSTQDWLIASLDDARGRFVTSTHGLVAALLVILLGGSVLARPREADLDPGPVSWELRVWAFLEQIGCAIVGLYATLGVLALLDAMRAAALMSPELLVHALRVAVDAPFQAALLIGSAPGP